MSYYDSYSRSSDSRNTKKEYNWLGFSISLVLCLAAFTGIWFLALPAWNIQSIGLWFFLLIAFCATTLISTGIGGMIDEVWLPTKINGWIALGMLAVFLVSFISSAKPFHVDDYRAPAQIVEGEDASTILPDPETMPIIDRNTARKLGDRTLGNIKSEHIGQFEVSSEYNLIVYNSEDYYISPLVYGGLLKYSNNKETGIPYYVLVNAHSGEAERIDLDAEHTIKYAPSAYWGYDLTRHLRMEYPGKLFAGENFEVDDNGHPYYIIPTLKNTASLFGASVIDTVIVMDAHTGESTEYALNEVPEWVDNVYEVDRLMTQAAWNYNLIHGCFNLSNKDVRKTSYSYDTQQYYAFTHAGHTWVYTGVTSAGADESNIGFLAMSLRTGEYLYFADPGAEESSAQESAKGLVQQYGYTAGPVMLINVDGEQTYFCALKDAQNLVKKYALVNKTDYTKVVVEDTMEDAIKVYQEKMGNTSEPDIEASEAKAAEGVVSAVYEVTVDGNTMFIFYLEGSDEYYVSTIGNSFEQPAKLVVGSTVAIVYSVVDDTNVVNEINFK